MVALTTGVHGIYLFNCSIGLGVETHDLFSKFVCGLVYVAFASGTLLANMVSLYAVAAYLVLSETRDARVFVLMKPEIVPGKRLRSKTVIGSS